MKKLESILLIISVIAIIANLSFIQGSGMILIFSLGALAIYYFYIPKVWAKTALSSIDNFKKRLNGSGFSVLTVGILFTIMIWPNGSGFIIIGILLTLFATFFRLKTPDGEALVDNSLRTKSIIFILVGVIFLSIPKRSWIEYKFKEYPEYVNAWQQSQDNPDNKELRQQLQDEYMKMAEKKKLLK